MSLQTGRIYVAGHRGLVGSAIVRRLQALGIPSVITRSHAELDLTNQASVSAFFEQERPDYVFLCAAKVGGILANATRPAQFLFENLAIQTNVIHAAWTNGVERLLFLGSSCIYPRDCPQPIREEYLLGGPLEATNRPYAVAKIAGIEMCWAYNRQYGTRFLAAMPTNLYGPGDNYDLETAHVLPSLIRKMHEAKIRNSPDVVVWGTGQPRREFLFSDDLADAVVSLMNIPDDALRKIYDSPVHPPLLNIGCGEDLSILELAVLVKEIVGFDGDIRLDASRPDGTPRKLLDVSRMRTLGWTPRTGLREGIDRAYRDFLTSA
ncbi:MAG: GDP-L-fucose synthase [Burkholderiaceae bacterium]|nr:GDP-L-fucose synthase [Burkholderiaceae bacterium]